MSGYERWRDTGAGQAPPPGQEPEENPKVGYDPWQGGGPGTPGWSLPPDTTTVGPAGPSSPEYSDMSWFAQRFRQAGYNWLGPGTDVEYNIAHGIQPVDKLDEIAMIHDLDYNAVYRDF